MAFMDIQEGVQLKDYTTFHIGGIADFFVRVRTVDELREAVRFAHERQLPITILGGGSNMLIGEQGIRGVVIKIDIEGIRYEQTGEYDALVHVGAGMMLDALVEDTIAHGYWGLENLSAIPGTVGATPVQNVGAYGVEIGSRIASVAVYDMVDEKEITLSAVACAFGYRTSLFKTDAGKQYIITGVTFALTRVPRPHIEYADLRKTFGDTVPSQRDIRATLIQIRGNKFPDWTVVGTAGSFFKNPSVTKEKYAALRTKYEHLPGYENEDGSIKIPLGFVIDKIIGMRGVCVGNVGTYEAQSLVIVNYGGATADDVDAFAQEIEKKVFDAIGVRIEREVRMFL
jgi:UDP-N-acetylmuramate dehydrogenase